MAKIYRKILSSEEIEAGGFKLAEKGVVCPWQRVDFVQVKGGDQTTPASEKCV